MKKPISEQDKAERIIQKNSSLEAERSNYDSLCDQLAKLIQPRKDQILTTRDDDTTDLELGLFNETAIHANQVLAGGQMDYLFSGRWFAYDAPPELQADDAKQWYQRCTEITMRELGRSNFFLMMHEAMLDRGGFGTAAILLDEGTKNLLAFHKFDIGTFSIAEDYEGNVDTIYRKFKLTARQAEQQFDEDKLGKGIRDALKDPKSADKKFTFIHAIYPRKSGDYDDKKQDKENMPIASCYVCVEDKKLVKESGYPEIPFQVSRYLKWGASVYGYCPGAQALGTIRQVNFMEKMWDAMTEIKAFPRVLIPENLVGDVDLRSSGVTVFDPNNPNAMPKEWGTAGDDRALQLRVDSKNEAINRAFHVDLFQILQQIERQMTAYEAQQRIAEKVTAFSPTFYRLQVEVVNPLLSRTFAILFRAGKFPPPPESVMVPSPDGKSASLALPEVTLTSKLALAIKSAENNAFVQAFTVISPIAQVQPDVLDNWDLDKASRGIGSNFGVPVDWQRPEVDRDEMRAARAKAAAAAAQVELAQGGAKAAKDFSQASPEVRQGLAQSMGG